MVLEPVHGLLVALIATVLTACWFAPHFILILPLLTRSRSIVEATALFFCCNSRRERYLFLFHHLVVLIAAEATTKGLLAGRVAPASFLLLARREQDNILVVLGRLLPPQVVRTRRKLDYVILISLLHPRWEGNEVVVFFIVHDRSRRFRAPGAVEVAA